MAIEKNSLPDNQESIVAFAKEIKEKHLSFPVILLIEMHRPLAGIVEALTEVLSPFLGLFLTKEKLSLLKAILADSEQVEFLLQKLSES